MKKLWIFFADHSKSICSCSQFDTDAFARLRLKLPSNAATESGEIVARFALPSTGGELERYVVQECTAAEATQFVNLIPDVASKKYSLGTFFEFSLLCLAILFSNLFYIMCRPTIHSFFLRHR
jgi:hypothetical protein